MRRTSARDLLFHQINAETRREHPIAIESGRFTGSQINYSTSEKEFLAIVQAFVRNRHMLLQVATQVVTDHLNLTYWMEPRQLSPRQARWMEHGSLSVQDHLPSWKTSYYDRRIVTPSRLSPRQGINGRSRVQPRPSPA